MKILEIAAIGDPIMAGGQGLEEEEVTWPAEDDLSRLVVKQIGYYMEGYIDDHFNWNAGTMAITAKPTYKDFLSSIYFRDAWNAFERKDEFNKSHKIKKLVRKVWHEQWDKEWSDEWLFAGGQDT